MKTIYLVRHGEAENNVRTTRAYVAESAKLTPKGEEQAVMIANRVVKLPVTALVASDFVRAQQTAKAVSKKTGLTVETSPLFGERRAPSDLVGMLWDDPATRQREREWEKTLATENTRVGDGENYADILQRIKDALEYLEAHPADEIAVVTHGFFQKALITYIAFQDALTPAMFGSIQWRMRTTNTGLSIIRFDPEDRNSRWWLTVFNDHTHLG